MAIVQVLFRYFFLFFSFLSNSALIMLMEINHYFIYIVPIIFSIVDSDTFLNTIMIKKSHLQRKWTAVIFTKAPCFDTPDCFEQQHQNEASFLDVLRVSYSSVASDASHSQKNHDLVPSPLDTTGFNNAEKPLETSGWIKGFSHKGWTNVFEIFSYKIVF